MKIFNSFVNEQILGHFYPDYKQNGFDLYKYANWKCGIDGLITAAYLFSPDIIQIEDYIFIKDFWGPDTRYHDSISILKEQFNNDKKMIEMWVNSWSLGDFFFPNNVSFLDDEAVIRQFGEVLVYYWSKRVKELFPERNIVVELGYELMGESGLCITMYEDMETDL